MPVNIGPQIGIDGYADFTRSMKNIISQSKELASEMKLVTSSFDKNDASQEKLAAQMQVLNKQIDLQSKRVDLLADRYSESEKKVSDLRSALQKAVQEYGETSKEAQSAAAALDRQEAAASKAKTEYNNARTALNKMNSELGDLEKQASSAADGVDDVTDSLKDAESTANSLDFGDVLSAGAIIESAKGIIDAIGQTIDEVSDYRKIMGSLDIASEKAGYTADETSESYTRLYGVLGDDQTAATTLSNLQALSLSQDKLTQLLDSSVGAWATYGDSIPIDGLAEAINETVRTGTVTGTFADVLNWGSREGETFGVMLKENTDANKEWNDAVADAVTAEDYFNLALQDASTEAERANLVYQAMASQGLEAAGQQWREQNQDIVAANEAQAVFTENAATLAERVAPAVNAVKVGFNDLFAAALQMTEGIDFQAVADAISAGFAFVIENKDIIVQDLAAIGAGIAALKLVKLGTDIASIASGAASLTSVFPALGGAVTALTGPFGLVIAAITGVVLVINTFGDQIQAVLQSADDFLQGVFATDFTQVFGPVIGGVLNTFLDVFQGVWEAFKGILDGVIDIVRGVFTGDWERAWNGVVGIFKGLFEGIVSIAKGVLNGVITVINMVLSGINALINGVNHIPGVNIPNIPTIPMLSKGGIVRSGSAIVGEAGPELMTVLGNRTVVQPLPAGSVSSNGGRYAAAAQVRDVNITVYGAEGQDVNQLADIIMQRIESATNQREAVF